MGKFNTDLKFGEVGESIIVDYLSTKGLKYQGTSKELHPDRIKYYDLLFTGRKGNVFVEVKTDKYISDTFDTNNIVFEISCSGKPSGVYTTSADLWVNYFVNKSKDNIWTIRVSDLKAIIEAQKSLGIITIKSGGDNFKTRLCVLNRFDYKEHFNIDTYIK